MQSHREDEILTAAFAPIASLEPTAAEVAAVVRRSQTNAPLRGRIWRLRISGGALVAGFGVMVAIAVAGLALTLGGRRTQPAGHAATAPDAQSLIAKLGVLRRPQTSADRLPEQLRFQGRSGPGRLIIPSLTRLVATTPAGRVFLVVIKPGAIGNGDQPLFSPAFGYEVSLIGVSSSGSAFMRAPVPAAVLSDPRLVLPVVIGHTRYLSEILPDGVARVRWLSPRPSPSAILATPPVANNVAVLTITPSLAAARALWYGADSHPIATSKRQLNAVLQSARARATARQARVQAANLAAAERSTVRAPSVLLQRFALFSPSAIGVHASGIQISHPTIRSLPPNIIAITSGGPGPGQLDLHQIREISTSAGARVWVVPGTNGLCMFTINPPRLQPGSTFGGGIDSGGQGSCPPSLSSSLTHGASSDAYLPNGTKILIGALPIGTSNRRIIRKDGTTTPLSLTDGVYAILDAGIRSIS